MQAPGTQACWQAPGWKRGAFRVFESISSLLVLLSIASHHLPSQGEFLRVRCLYLGMQKLQETLHQPAALMMAAMALPQGAGD